MRLNFYNSQTREFRHGKTYRNMSTAAKAAATYFETIKRDGIFGEADKVYLETTNGSGVLFLSHVWKNGQWKELQ